MNIHIAVIDDETDSLQNVSTCLNAWGNRPHSFRLLDILSTPITEGNDQILEALRQAIISFNPAENGVENGVVLFLDVDLKTARPSWLEQHKSKFPDYIVDWNRYGVTDTMIPPALIASAALANQKLRPLTIAIVSSATRHEALLPALENMRSRAFRADAVKIEQLSGSLWLLPDVTPRLEQAMQLHLDLVDWHDVQVVSDTIKFYDRTFPSESRHNSHDRLEDPFSRESEAAKAWLALSECVDSESAKALFCWTGRESSHWGIDAEIRRTRAVSGRVLKLVLNKLGIAISNLSNVQDDVLYQMPCNPCLPFFVSLAHFYYKLCNDLKYPPPEQVELEMTHSAYGEDSYCLSFTFATQDKAGAKIEPLQLEAACATAMCDDEPGDVHTTTLRLWHLRRARTVGLKIENEQTKLFKNGCPGPAVKIESKGHCVKVLWKAKC